eukprot:CAMPEP_0172510490 /NCGR_PEP_ID=MMETSP1066-20121228/228834_1 /TAXON_ID=671091 /ORGANISM="Coscinodiscus wailesii, Strain CCMP2513" /LENGTH=284 /DNA_ID=CAMNT_0013289455 /DNA_START=199 /DNA_END=1050 /DNA_ORIENTATION=-
MMDPKSVVYKPASKNKPVQNSSKGKTVIALINTPNSGTEEIFSHFSNSFGCTLQNSQVDDVFYAPCVNPKSVSIVKSHDKRATVPLLRRLLRHLQQYEIPTECLIVTALRDPQKWFSTKFIENHKKMLCGMTDMTADEAIEEYQMWFERDAIYNRYMLQSVIRGFLNKYGVTLSKQMKLMQKNGGYSVVPPVPALKEIQGRGVPVESVCSLLLLDYDKLRESPERFNDVLPGALYQSPKKRQMCSEDAARYKTIRRAIRSYKFTNEELEKFIGKDDFSPYLEDW